MLLDQTDAFLKIHDVFNKRFVETSWTKKCRNQLHNNGMVVLKGNQGCGKTLASVSIMTDKYYEEWSKLKFTSWRDLLTFDLPQKTLVFIDDMLDGFSYAQDIHNWWNTLCYFYSECVMKKKVHLLITAKNSDVNIACAHMKADMFLLQKVFIVTADTLSLGEKHKILEMQMEASQETKHISHTKITNTTRERINNHGGNVGFPLCAHLYAFEKYKKDNAIFGDSRLYVREQVFNAIDKKEETKFLLFFLILYFFQNGSNQYLKSDLIRKDELIRYLEENFPDHEKLFSEIEMLQIGNLRNTARDLEEIILIKYHKVYAFKHKIYLESVVDYFFRKYFDIAVQYFPLEAINAYEFESCSNEQWSTLIDRLLKEILNHNISRTLSCKIFKEPEFETQFCKKLRTNNNIRELLYTNDMSSTFELPFIFWASKYRLTKLSKMLWDIAEEEAEQRLPDYQFYLVRFGECCGENESYIKDKPSRLSLENLRTVVSNFKMSDSEKRSILHLLVSSDKSDIIALCCLRKILKDFPNGTLPVDSDLLNLTLKERNRSRILCILEIINRLDDKSNIHNNESIECVIDSKNKAFWELEWIVRISIVNAYNEIQPETACVKIYSFPTECKQLKAILSKENKKQTKMAQIINSHIKECHKSLESSSNHALEIGKIQFKGRIQVELKEAIMNSIHVLSNWK